MGWGWGGGLHSGFLRSLLALQTLNADRSVDEIGPTLLKQVSQGGDEGWVGECGAMRGEGMRGGRGWGGELHCGLLLSLLALQTLNADRSVDEIGPTLLKQVSQG